MERCTRERFLEKVRNGYKAGGRLRFLLALLPVFLGHSRSLLLDPPSAFRVTHYHIMLLPFILANIRYCSKKSILMVISLSLLGDILISWMDVTSIILNGTCTYYCTTAAFIQTPNQLP